LIFFSQLFQKSAFGDKRRWFLMDRTSFSSPGHQCPNTEGNSKNWPQPTTSSWLQPPPNFRWAERCMVAVCRMSNVRTMAHYDTLTILERCNPWPHVANRHISKSHCDVSLSRLGRSQPASQLFTLWCHSHSDVIRYWAGHAQRYGRTYVTCVRTPYRVEYKKMPIWYSKTARVSHRQDGLHGLLTGPFLLSISVFVFLFFWSSFFLFLFLVPCGRLSCRLPSVFVRVQK